MQMAIDNYPHDFCTRFSFPNLAAAAFKSAVAPVVFSTSRLVIKPNGMAPLQIPLLASIINCYAALRTATNRYYSATRLLPGCATRLLAAATRLLWSATEGGPILPSYHPTDRSGALQSDRTGIYVNPRTKRLEMVLEPKSHPTRPQEAAEAESTVATMPGSRIQREIAALEKEIAWHCAQIAILKAKRNSLPPTCSLPNELLCRIFTIYAVDSDSLFDLKSVKKIMYVCHRWHNLAVATQPLWSFIQLGWGRRRIPRFYKQLERSGAAPITLRIEVFEGYYTPAIVENAGRIQAVELRGEGKNIYDLIRSLPHHDFPILSSLNLDPSHKHDELPEGVVEALPEAVFDGRMPRLQELVLRSIAIPWRSLRGLTMLCLTDCGDTASLPHTFAVMLEMLDACPQLRTLKLEQAMPPPLLDIHYPTVDLAALAWIRLRDDADTCATLLNHLHFPPTTSVHVFPYGVRAGPDVSDLLIPIRKHLRAPAGATAHLVHIKGTVSPDRTHSIVDSGAGYNFHPSSTICLQSDRLITFRRAHRERPGLCPFDLGDNYLNPHPRPPTTRAMNVTPLVCALMLPNSVQNIGSQASRLNLGHLGDPYGKSRFNVLCMREHHTLSSEISEQSLAFLVVGTRRFEPLRAQSSRKYSRWSELESTAANNGKVFSILTCHVRPQWDPVDVALTSTRSIRAALRRYEPSRQLLSPWDSHRAAFRSRLKSRNHRAVQTRLDSTNERERRRVDSLVQWTQWCEFGVLSRSKTLFGPGTNLATVSARLDWFSCATETRAKFGLVQRRWRQRSPVARAAITISESISQTCAADAQIRPLSRYESRATTRGERSMDAAILIRAWAGNGRRAWWRVVRPCTSAVFGRAAVQQRGGMRGLAWRSTTHRTPARKGWMGGGLEASADSVRGRGDTAGYLALERLSCAARELAGLAGLARRALYATGVHRGRPVWDQHRAKANRSSWVHLASQLGGLRSGFDGQCIGPRALAAHTQLPRMRGSVRVCDMRARMREKIPIGIFDYDIDGGPGGVAFETRASQRKLGCCLERKKKAGSDPRRCLYVARPKFGIASFAPRAMMSIPGRLRLAAGQAPRRAGDVRGAVSTCLVALPPPARPPDV
ncbi:hypothetical protein B0H17DRAFT_1295056 [Mycena rosella]|uniref:F-box domain-containing protein n=1 Tax=Mycena rosella TaxID=1033263 RepID=A0AAD7FF83_MYCRO|nr:hypothetical protein B0H17DRAFT_1295056 [Mycena rosella]